MKKLDFKFIILVFLSTLVVSCGGFFGTDITDQEGINKNIVPEISKIIPKNTSVIEIDFSSKVGGTFSKAIGFATVTYFEKGSNELKAKCITLSGKVEGKDATVSETFYGMSHSELKVKPSDGQKIENIDFSKIASNVNKAVKILTDGGNEFSGFKSYNIKLNTDPSKIVHEFTIQSKQNSKTSTKSGRLATEIGYLDINFVADAEGNLVEKE